MKTIIVLIAMIFSTTTYAQNSSFSNRDCRKIEVTKDGFTGDVTMSTPTLTNKLLAPTFAPLRFIAVFRDNGMYSYYLSLHAIGLTLNVGESGARILFEDGTQFYRDVKIKVQSGEGPTWDYSAFINLTDEEAKLFTQKRVNKLRLYIYDVDIRQRKADEFANMVHCITSKTKVN